MINLTEKIDQLLIQRTSQYISIIKFMDNIKLRNANLAYSEIANHLLIILKPYSYRLTCYGHSDYHNPYFYEDWIKNNGIKTYSFDEFHDLNCIAKDSNPDFLFIALEYIRDNFTNVTSNVGTAKDYIPSEYHNLFLDKPRLDHLLLNCATPAVSIGKEIKGKSETSYLNLILALKEVCLSDNKFKNQEELIFYLVSTYQGYVGMSESNIRDKFAKSSHFK
ncbi:hypothetical protein Q7472_05610 [Glaesserella parasuis]|uniref:hypothetical protein n=1 Tax=Glaesserella parasuis TaxID=738 RepID=UPI0003ABE657|nr:hypothetical protein [Glaesserella parasuis]EQA13982.1 hypothetical protein HPSSW140_0308 [Glaesserella parasuis SW140]MDG6354845.1 hypothetical protein [Glaesserella parasuis]MDO9673870.1 hypothetical protein [Glaesserella parasuis]MDO9992671.1 hypothetical protein [Glaesserella parasuis]MDP0100612.1 hypothetical protein [Glaesserella parasuis]